MNEVEGDIACEKTDKKLIDSSPDAVYTKRQSGV